MMSEFWDEERWLPHWCGWLLGGDYEGRKPEEIIARCPWLQRLCTPLAIGDRVRVVAVDGIRNGDDAPVIMETGQEFEDFLNDGDFWGPTYLLTVGWMDRGDLAGLDWIDSASHAHLPACVS